MLNEKIGKVEPVLLYLYCRRLINQLNYEHKMAAIDACVTEYNDTQRVETLLDDSNYYVPHFLHAVNSLQRQEREGSDGGRVYLYQFEYDAIDGAWGHGTSPPEKAPRHSQDLVYLFGQNAGQFTSTGRRIQYLHSELFANFINRGDPNGVETRGFWPLNAERMNFYKIDFPKGEGDAIESTEKFIGDTPDYHRRAVEFWSEAMPK